MKRKVMISAAIVSFLMISPTFVAFSQELYKFELMWGDPGTGDGQFYGPSGVAVDASGNVYVTDTGNHRVQKFDSDGPRHDLA